MSDPLSTVVVQLSQTTASLVPSAATGSLNMYANLTDHLIYVKNASGTSTAVGGGGGGSGTVTSVAAGAGLTTGGGAITTTGTISIPASGVAAGTYSLATVVVNSLGLVTSASSGSGGGGSTGNWTFSGNDANITSGTMALGESAAHVLVGSSAGANIYVDANGTIYLRYGTTNYINLSYQSLIYVAPEAEGGGTLGTDGQAWKEMYLAAKAAPSTPSTSAEWVIYVDSGDGNKLKAKASTGTTVTLGTP